MTIVEIQEALVRVEQAHGNKGAYRDGADVGPKTWDRLMIACTPQQQFIGNGLMLCGVGIHKNHRAPEGQLWPCFCKEDQ